MPTRSYRRLREEDRHIIYRMRKAGNSQIQIAHALGFTQSAISKEFSRNCGRRGYRPKQANEKALERQRSKRARERVIIPLKDIKIKPPVWERMATKGFKLRGSLPGAYERSAKV